MHGQAKLLWFAGHVRIRGKEIAGKEGRKEDIGGPEPIFGVSKQHVKKVWIEGNVFQKHSCK